jgi:hypothetical protein
MSRVLPQQELLLELLMMSGEIAVNGAFEGTILWRTLMECKEAGWIRWSEIGAGYYKAEITQSGRDAA